MNNAINRIRVSDYLSIAVRGYVPLATVEKPNRSRPVPTPSEWVLVFDTETGEIVPHPDEVRLQG